MWCQYGAAFTEAGSVPVLVELGRVRGRGPSLHASSSSSAPILPRRDPTVRIEPMEARAILVQHVRRLRGIGIDFAPFAEDTGIAYGAPSRGGALPRTKIAYGATRQIDAVGGRLDGTGSYLPTPVLREARY
eukprot:3938994-Rhodomonas_salina.3